MKYLTRFSSVDEDMLNSRLAAPSKLVYRLIKKKLKQII